MFPGCWQQFSLLFGTLWRSLFQLYCTFWSLKTWDGYFDCLILDVPRFTSVWPWNILRSHWVLHLRWIWYRNTIGLLCPSLGLSSLSVKHVKEMTHGDSGICFGFHWSDFGFTSCSFHLSTLGKSLSWPISDLLMRQFFTFGNWLVWLFYRFFNQVNLQVNFVNWYCDLKFVLRAAY